MDVKKQRDLSGFYRHILNQTTADDTRSKVKDEKPVIKQEKTEETDGKSNLQRFVSRQKGLAYLVQLFVAKL